VHKKYYSGSIGILILVLITLLVLASGGWYLNKKTRLVTRDDDANLIPKELSPEVEVVLSKKLSLIEDLAANGVIISEAKSQSVKNSSLAAAEIKKLDDSWQTSDNGFVEGFLTNKVAFELLEFQEINPGFPEIFVTDSIGLNIGQTNKTSDYYQADEDWWIDAYADGTGKSYHGSIEYDESAQSESVPLYVPVFDNGGKVVGVIKAVLDIRAIQRELK